MEILNCLARRAVAEIVEAGDDDEAFAGVVQGESDIAEIGVRDVLQLGQRASGPDAHQGAASVELSEDGFDGFGGIRRAERHVNGGKNSASQREQMSGKHETIFGQTSVVKNFGSVAMREQVVGLEIFVDLDEVKVATGIFACAAGTGLAVADDAAALGDEAGFGERAQGENHAGGVAAGIGNKARGCDFSSVQLGKTVDRFAEPACVGSGELVPGRKGIRGAKTEGAAEIDDAEASLQQRGGALPTPRSWGKSSARHFLPCVSRT